MTPDEVRGCCLSMSGATEEFPFGDEVSVFKVGGKIFAISGLEASPLEVSVKCDPDIGEQMRKAYAAVRPGYHLNKRHWNTITLDGSLDTEMIVGMIQDSYDLVVNGLPKRERERFRRPD